MDGSDWTFALLGPLEVRHRGTLVPVPAQRQRALLATLLLNNGKTVVLDDLAHRVWSGKAPGNAASSMYSLVMRLRRTLAPEIVQTRGLGYAIDVPAEAVDVHGSMALWQQAQRADATDRVDLLRKALALWRGDPLADVASEILHREEVPALYERWARLAEEYFEAELQAGRHRDILGALRDATSRHRYREGLWAKLMLALHRSGRQAEALQAFHDVRALLRDELGLDPGHELRSAQQAVLADDTGPASGPDAPEAAWLGQFRLPPDNVPLAGRGKDIAMLIEVLRPHDNVVPVVAITGPPGVGKSALAVRVAHQLRTSYPDGQWHLSLDGAGERPRPTGQLLDELLRTAGVAPAAIPASVDERAGLLRARLAGRRVLLVLDNAANAAQVMPLLPGAAGCAVLITSRSGLGGLVATSGAVRHSLGTLGASEGWELLGQMLDGQRLTAEPQAAGELVELCGGLPLALRIVAANLASCPDKTLGEYAAELRGRDRLRHLAAVGDPQVGVRSAFGLSYASLPGAQRRAFRLLGLAPGADISVAAASALLGEPADPLLEALAGAHLVEPRAGGRYAMHDLLRLYAAERARSEEPDADTALRRLLYWYWHAAVAATKASDPGNVRFEPDPLPGVVPLSFPDTTTAMAWCEAERRNVVAAILHAAEHGDAWLAWQMFEAIRADLTHRQRKDEWDQAMRAALTASETAGDTRAVSYLLLSAGTLSWVKGEFPQAVGELERTATLARQRQDHHLLARALNNLGLVRLELGELDVAAAAFTEAVACDERADAPNPALRATILSNLGVVHLERGDLRQAQEASHASLAANRAVRSLRGEGIAECNLGIIARAYGDPDTAIVHYQAALDLAQRIEAPSGESAALVGLAAAHREAGRFELAHRSARRALATARAAGHRRSQTDALVQLGAVMLATGNAASALDTYRTARQIAAELAYRRGEVEALTGLAIAAHQAGEDDPVTVAEEAVSVAKSVGLRLLEAYATTALAHVLAGSGRPAQARTVAGQSLSLHRAYGCRHGEAEARDVLARLDGRSE